jgi:hypothetical protein
MGIVTFNTGSLSGGRVVRSRREILAPMASQAEIGIRLQKKLGVERRMGFMAGKAVADRHRTVDVRSGAGNGGMARAT